MFEATASRGSFQIVSENSGTAPSDGNPVVSSSLRAENTPGFAARAVPLEEE
jgi:hypothetical protein